jgi:hypothetical protein
LHPSNILDDSIDSHRANHAQIQVLGTFSTHPDQRVLLSDHGFRSVVLRSKRPVVDVDVVDQAGEEGVGRHDLAAANVQAAAAFCQTNVDSHVVDQAGTAC